MGDFGTRMKRYRLTRYAPPESPWRRHRKWILLGLTAWMLWAGVISDHSFYRLWRLDRESARARSELKTTRTEVDRLSNDLNDPQVLRVRAEGALRENGWIGPDEVV